MPSAVLETAASAPAVDSTVAAERAAVRAALEGDRLARLRIAHRAMRGLLADHNDTRQVLVLSIAINGPRLPRLLARFLADDDGLALMTERPAIDSRHVDYAALRALPEDTLGGAYVRFLDDNGLDPDLFQAPPDMPVALGYFAQRMRQSHDIWHVLTGCSTDVPGELELLAFTYAHTRMPSFLLIIVGGLLKFSFRQPEIFGRVLRGYRRGRAVERFLATVRWEQHWQRPLREVRAELGI